ncbi:hypothetical protein DMP64_30625, partial [Klebsiella pneumoniae]
CPALGESIMFESLVSMISSGAAASHTPQTAVAAVLCAALVGLVAVDDKVIQVTAKGRLLIRNICMCFDAYLRQKARMQQFSR